MAGGKEFSWMVKGVLRQNFPEYVSPRKSSLLKCIGPYGLEVQFQLRFQPGVLIKDGVPCRNNEGYRIYESERERPSDFAVCLEVVRCSHPAIKAAFKMTCGGPPDVRLMENTADEMVTHEFDTQTAEGRKYVWRVPTNNMLRMKNVIQRNHSDWDRPKRSLREKFAAFWFPQSQPTKDDFNVVLHVFNVEISLSGLLKKATDEFIDQFWSLYRQKKLTDFSITVGNTHFDVHKLVLAARSPVFAAMFDHDVAETEEGCVEITDFDAATIGKFVEFLYTGKCDLKENAAELLVCAEKYDVDQLKTQCQAVLIGQLKPGNAALVLQLADIHRAPHLKDATLNFIGRHTKEVMSTAQWATLSPERIGILLHFLCISVILYAGFRRWAPTQTPPVPNLQKELVFLNSIQKLLLSKTT